uniref:Uncharacterized protein n=1 Tax=Arundo donax TaxID=35708 RepID=A0A0A9CLL6_ARUDO
MPRRSASSKSCPAGSPAATGVRSLSTRLTTGTARRRAHSARLTAGPWGRPAASSAPRSAGQRSWTGIPGERRAHTSSSAADTSVSMPVAGVGAECFVTGG